MAQAQKLKIIIEANGNQVDAVLTKIHDKASEAAEQLKEMAKAGLSNTKPYKELQKVADALNNAEVQNIEGLKRVEYAMQHLATTATVDLRRALAAGSKELSLMSEVTPEREKLIDWLKRIKEQIDKNTGATRKQISELSLVDDTIKNLSKASVTAISDAVMAGETALKKMERGTAEYDNLRNKVALLKEELTRANKPIASQHELIKRVDDVFNNLSGTTMEKLREAIENGEKALSRMTAKSLAFDTMKAKVALLKDELNKLTAPPELSNDALKTRVANAAANARSMSTSQLHESYDSGKTLMSRLPAGAELNQVKQQMKIIGDQMAENEKITESYSSLVKKVDVAFSDLVNTANGDLREALEAGKKAIMDMFPGKELDETKLKLKAIEEQLQKNLSVEETQSDLIKKVDDAYSDLANTTNGKLREALEAGKKAMLEMKPGSALEDMKSKLQEIEAQLNRNLKIEETQSDLIKKVDDAYSDLANTTNGKLREALEAGKKAMLEMKPGPALEDMKSKLQEIEAQLNRNLKIEESESDLIRRVDTAYTDLAHTTNGDLRRALEAGKKAMDGMTDGKQLTEMKTKLGAIEAQLKKNLSPVFDQKKALAQVERAVKDLAGTTTGELRQALIAGKEALNNYSGSSAGLRELEQNLKRIQSQINKNTGEMSKNTKAWDTALKNLVAYTGLFSAFNQAKSFVEDTVKSLVKMSDRLADIRKVSGLTMNDIKQLSSELAKVDSRTSQNEMLGLSYQGAKLGMGEYGTEGLLAFTKAADQVNVALKEDLGEDALMAVSKFVENMGLIKKYGVEEAMLKTGSAMFKLASTSTASSDKIVEFTKRMMSAGRVAGITADQLLALGSAADSMGLLPEVASTAMNRFLSAIQTNHNLIEKHLSIEPGTLNRLYSAGKAMDAMVLVLDKMRGKNMNQLDGLFKWKELGGEGTRLKNVITTMSAQLPILRQHLMTSSEAFQDGIAVTQEYNIQQSTANALIERANNLWAKKFVSSKNVDVIHEMAQAWYDVSKAITSSKFATETLIIAFGALKLLVTGFLYMLPTLLMMLGSAGLVATLSKLLSLLVRLPAVLRLVRMEWALLSTAMKGGWIGALVGLLAALGVGLYNYISNVMAAKASTDTFNYSLRDFEAQAGVAKRRLDALRGAIDRAKQGTEQRAKLIRNFNKEYGQYLGKMLDEKATADEIAQAYNRVNTALRGKLALEGMQKDEQKYVQPIVGDVSMRWARFQEATQKNSRFAAMTLDAVMPEVQSLVKKGFGQKYIMQTLLGKYTNLGKKRIDEYIASVYRGVITDKEAARQSLELPREHDREIPTVRLLYSAIGGEAYLQRTQNKVQKKWNPMKGVIDKYNKLNEINPGSLDHDAPDKEEERAARAEARAQRQEQRDRKDAIRQEIQDAERDANAVISNINSFYEIQQAAVEQLVADLKMSRTQADSVLRYLNIHKNQVLEQARYAITGMPNSFDQMRTSLMPEDIIDNGDMTKNTLLAIQNVDPDKVQSRLNKYKGEGELGISSQSNIDSILKNAATNKHDAAALKSQRTEEARKMLLQNSYYALAADESDKQMETVGVTRDAETFMQKMNEQRVENERAMEEYRRRKADREKRYAAWQKTAKPGEEFQDTEPIELPAPITFKDRSMREAKDMLRAQFIARGSKNYGFDMNDKTPVTLADGSKSTQGDVNAQKWLDDFMSAQFTDKNGNTVGSEAWTPVVDIEKLKSDTEAVKAFYTSLVMYEDSYWDARNKHYTESSKTIDERWTRSGKKDYYEHGENQLELGQKKGKLNGRDTGSVWQQVGLGDTIREDDPEIALYEKKLEAATAYYEMCKAYAADQQKIDEAQRAQQEAALVLSEQIADRIQQRMDKMQTALDPVKDFAQTMGEAFVTMADDAKDGRDMLRRAAADMIKAYAQMTIKMLAQQVTQRIQRALFHKQMEKMEKKHNATLTKSSEQGGKEQLSATETLKEGVVSVTEKANAKTKDLANKKAADDKAQTTAETQGGVFAGIAQGAAKIIGKLGWWGIPLVAVIQALLMGLLNKALSKLGGGSSESASTNTKLVTGMLTYDRGNVQEFRGVDDGQSFPVAGNDGRVYAVGDVARLQTGIVSRPLLTTVNGRPSLVGERGPEMVIGRETTSAMMMSRPDLLREIVRFDRNRSRAVAQTFDRGNVGTFAQNGSGSLRQSAVMSSPADASQPSPAPLVDAETLAALQSLAPTLAALTEQLKQPIRAKMDMWGREGAYEQMEKARQFMKKYR